MLRWSDELLLTAENDHFEVSIQRRPNARCVRGTWIFTTATASARGGRILELGREVAERRGGAERGLGRLRDELSAAISFGNRWKPLETLRKPFQTMWAPLPMR